MKQLTPHDMQWCLQRTPRPLLQQLQKHSGKLFIAGGFIRSSIANERINDIDCFVPNAQLAMEVALELVGGDQKKVHGTDNALTVRIGHHCIQFIHRWTFETPEQAIESFDFTIAQAALWWNNVDNFAEWDSVCSTRFYADLAAKRLVYTCPKRNEDAGGSLLRVLKFYQRGYRIPLPSFANVIARMLTGINPVYNILSDDKELVDELQAGRIIHGLLREVDPATNPDAIAYYPDDMELVDP